MIDSNVRINATVFQQFLWYKIMLWIYFFLYGIYFFLYGISSLYRAIKLPSIVLKQILWCRLVRTSHWNCPVPIVIRYRSYLLMTCYKLLFAVGGQNVKNPKKLKVNCNHLIYSHGSKIYYYDCIIWILWKIKVSKGTRVVCTCYNYIIK